MDVRSFFKYEDCFTIKQSRFHLITILERFFTTPHIEMSNIFRHKSFFFTWQHSGKARTTPFNPLYENHKENKSVLTLSLTPWAHVKKDIGDHKYYFNVETTTPFAVPYWHLCCFDWEMPRIKEICHELERINKV